MVSTPRTGVTPWGGVRRWFGGRGGGTIGGGDASHLTANWQFQICILLFCYSMFSELRYSTITHLLLYQQLGAWTACPRSLVPPGKRVAGGYLHSSTYTYSKGP